MSKIIRILFVCTGNTCRSVMAQGLFQKLWKELSSQKIDVQVASAGVGAAEGLKASEEALEILRSEGLDFSGHRSSRVRAEMVEKADYILVMGSAHKEYLLKLFPEAAEKIWLLTEFAGMNTGDVPDPFGQGLEYYRRVAAILKEALKKIIKKLGD